MHPITLRFEGELNDEFLARYTRQNMVYLRGALLVAVALFFVFSVVDLFILPPKLGRVVALRALFAAPPLAAVWVLTRTSASQWVPRVLPWALLVASESYVVMLWVAPQSVNHQYHFGLFPLVMGIYTFFRMRFIQASVCGILLLISFSIVAMGLPLDQNAILAVITLMVCTNILGMGAAYAVERYARVYFLKSRLLEQNRAELQAEVEQHRATARGLREASRQAIAASRAKSEFLAKMSHEIRTPMNGVLGMNELLLSSDLNVEQRRAARTVSSSGRALLGVINDVLDFSKIESGKMTVVESTVEIRSMTRDVIGLLRHQSESKGIELRSSIASDIPQNVRGDPTRLRQILLNLVGNAVKFTDTGSIHLKVSCSEPGRLAFSVTDTGCGIPDEHLARMFDPFEQLDGRSSNGTGLGLAISSELVRLMGGKLSVESTLGSGSRFWFEIDAPEAVIALPKTEAAEVPFGGLKPKVLVVDDNRVNRAVASGILRKLGCEAIVVSGGNEAVEAAGKTSFDVILMDLRMPEVDGLEATRRIRALSCDRARTPIIALTADAQEQDRQRCLAGGMDDYLSKPIIIDELRTAITQLMVPSPPVLTASQDCVAQTR